MPQQWLLTLKQTCCKWARDTTNNASGTSEKTVRSARTEQKHVVIVKRKSQSGEKYQKRKWSKLMFGLMIQFKRYQIILFNNTIMSSFRNVVIIQILNLFHLCYTFHQLYVAMLLKIEVLLSTLWTIMLSIRCHPTPSFTKFSIKSLWRTILFHLKWVNKALVI